ncbi:gamma-glutamylcyclotransferase family protein [Sporomusa sp.]|uniref:gamma-glutamylcyclotransferase family protein n=1 Tax=Sporomusa sp. TaxID=2078658 RepID=UPI002B919868|nr:gamma-glutamylcyclotransferase family protein [Sporomusa sp.]HWR42069.1 gamma-glutamylcyclotransferase family protein [Sporomusa sp.]
MLNKVFVYGTLKQGFCNHGKIQPFCKSIQSAVLQGILYDLPFGYPGAVDGNGQIIGEVIELINAELALVELDRLEDYFGPGCADNLYERVVRGVSLANGDIVSTYVYLWSKPQALMQLGRLNPQGEWR